MSNDARLADGVPCVAMVTLMLAVFTVSVGYGVVLPLLPSLIERLPSVGTTPAQVSRHTGVLTGVYTLAPFLFAPVWGKAWDRLGRRNVLLFGLFGFGVTMVVFSFVQSLAAVYTERFLSGMFAATVTPVAAAAISEFVATDQARAAPRIHQHGRYCRIPARTNVERVRQPLCRRVFFGAAADRITYDSAYRAAILAILIGIAVALTVPPGRSRDRLKKATIASADSSGWLVPNLFVLTFIASTEIGVFEVGLAFLENRNSA